MIMGLHKLPDSWIEVFLSDISTIRSGYGFPEKYQGKKTGKYPFYKVKDISKAFLNRNNLLKESENYIDDDELEKINAKPFEKNTIVFAKIGEALKLNRRAILTQDSLVDNNVMGVLSDNKLCFDLFLFYFLNTVELEKISRATTVPSVRKQDIDKILVPVPPFNEQIRIVGRIEELFSRLDAGVRSLQAAQTRLEQYRQATLQQAYTGKLTKIWRQINNATDEDTLTMLKEINVKYNNKKLISDLYQKKEYLPIGWFFVNLGDVVVIENGNTPKGINNVSGEGEIPFYKVSDMNYPENSQYMTKSEIYLTKEEVIKYKINVSNGKNIIFPKRGGAISTNKKRILSIPAAYDTNIMGLKPINVLSEYIYYWFESFNLMTIASGSNVPQINNKDIIPLKISICSKEEQYEIIKELQRIFSLLNKINNDHIKNIKYAHNLNQSILKKAFQGKLVPQCPNDEPANVLIERIKDQRANQTRLM